MRLKKFNEFELFENKGSENVDWSDFDSIKQFIEQKEIKREDYNIRISKNLTFISFKNKKDFINFKNDLGMSDIEFEENPKGMRSHSILIKNNIN